MKEMLVSDVMTTPVATVYNSDSLAVAYDIMTDKGIRHLPVINRSRELVGILTHRDLVRSALFALDELPFSEEQRFLEQTSVSQVMTSHPETVSPDMSLADAAEILLDNKYGCLPVIESNHIAGILTESDFIKLVLKDLRGESGGYEAGA